MTRDDIVSAARAWIGTPFVHQGRTRAGVDCIGLVLNVGWELGFLPREYDVRGYSRIPDGRLFAECDRMLTRIPAPAVGGVLVMRFDIEPQHLAFVGEHGGHLTVIHSLWNRDRKLGKVVETRLSGDLPSKIVGCFDVPGIA
jgi:hypothetical protein